MMYVLISIRLTFCFLAIMLLTAKQFGIKIGHVHPRFQPLYFWTKQFYQHMKTSDNARKFFIYLLIILMVIAQAIDLTLVTDYGYMQISTKSIYVQFGIGMAFTIALFRYNFADHILSFRCKPFHLIMASVLVSMLCIISLLIVIMDIVFILFLGWSLYPQKVGNDDPKGRKSIPVIEIGLGRFRKAAMFFLNSKRLAV